MPKIKIYEDRLVTEWREGYGSTARISRRGKRINRLRILTREEQREYVKHGAVACVRLIRERIGTEMGTLARALTWLNSERFHNRQDAIKHTKHFDERLMQDVSL